MTFRNSLVFAVALAGGVSCGRAGYVLRGDWDYYRTLGAQPSGGFDGWRRFGFVHFERADTAGAWIKRRQGTPLEHIRTLAVVGDSLILQLAGEASIRARIAGDSITGQYYRGKEPTQRIAF